VIPSGVEVFVATAPVDLRAGFDRLAGLVLETLKGDPRSGSLYIFTNRRRTHLKALFFDRTGYCVLYKRLDRGTYVLPTVTAPGSPHVEVSEAQLAALLAGVVPLRRASKQGEARGRTSRRSSRGLH
jgi:transposase